MSELIFCTRGSVPLLSQLNTDVQTCAASIAQFVDKVFQCWEALVLLRLTLRSFVTQLSEILWAGWTKL